MIRNQGGAVVVFLSGNPIHTRGRQAMEACAVELVVHGASTDRPDGAPRTPGPGLHSGPANGLMNCFFCRWRRRPRRHWPREPFAEGYVMSPILHMASTAGMVIFTVIGFCCSISVDRDGRDGRDGAWRPSSDVFFMAAMVIAMVDVAVASVSLLPNVVWALILVVAGPAAAGASRLRTSQKGLRWRRCQPHWAYTGVFQACPWGVLVLFVHTEAPVQMLAPSIPHAHGAAGTPLWALTASIVVFVVFSVYVVHCAVQAARNIRAAHAIEALGSIAAISSIAAMLY